MATAVPSSPGRKGAGADALSHVARLAEAGGDAAHAEEALAAALQLRPRFPDLHLRRGRALRSLQRPAEARVALERALELNPGYTAARLELALLDAGEGFVAEAIEALRALARGTGLERPEEFRQGIESIESADLDQASLRLASGLGLEPADGEGLLERARVRLEAGDAEGAEQLLHPALPGRESWPDLHYLLGCADLHRGRHDDALASLARALELNPDFHAARVQFARALEATGASGAAGEQILLVLQSDPAHPQALDLHERWSRRGRRAAHAG